MEGTFSSSLKGKKSLRGTAIFEGDQSTLESVCCTDKPLTMKLINSDGTETEVEITVVNEENGDFKAVSTNPDEDYLLTLSYHKGILSFRAEQQSFKERITLKPDITGVVGFDKQALLDAVSKGGAMTGNYIGLDGQNFEITVDEVTISSDTTFTALECETGADIIYTVAEDGTITFVATPYVSMGYLLNTNGRIVGKVMSISEEEVTDDLNEVDSEKIEVVGRFLTPEDKNHGWYSIKVVEKTGEGVYRATIDVWDIKDTTVTLTFKDGLVSFEAEFLPQNTSDSENTSGKRFFVSTDGCILVIMTDENTFSAFVNRGGTIFPDESPTFVSLDDDTLVLQVTVGEDLPTITFVEFSEIIDEWEYLLAVNNIEV